MLKKSYNHELFQKREELDSVIMEGDKMRGKLKDQEITIREVRAEL